MQIEEVIYSVLIHSLTKDGNDAVEEGVDCIITLIHHGYKDKKISPGIWRLYPQLLHICVASEAEKEGGLGFEIVGQICIAIKNFISRDPDGLLVVGEAQKKTNLELTY